MAEKEFIEECNKVTQALSSVLGIELGESKKMELGIIGLYYHDLEKALASNDIKLEKYALEKLKRLLGELLAAKAFFEHQIDHFKSIVRDLRSDEPTNSFGARAELMVLNFLLEDYYHEPSLSLDDIIKRESPDYSIKTSNGEVFLEVTHVHVYKAKKKGTGYKITRAIRAKSKKTYANRDTVLFLDITNLTYREISTQRNINELIPYAKKTLSDSGFGAVVLMYSVFTAEGKYTAVYFTILHNEASQSLVVFLNQHYPNRPTDPERKLFPMLTM